MSVLKTCVNRLSINSSLHSLALLPLRRGQATIISGNKIAAEIQSELAVEIEKWSAVSKRKPMLVAILVGDDPASATYVAHKLKVAKKVGVNSKAEHYPTSYSEIQLLSRIQDLNRDEAVDGILVQLPLPKSIDDKLICRTISPQKDVDGFNALNMGELCLARESLSPCTPLGVMEMLSRSNISTRGKTAVVIGRSKNVGLPIALMLHAHPRDATTTICHRKTPKDQLEKLCQNADILVAATGIPGLVTANMVKPGACVIDVGITRITDANGKARLIGDVDFQGVNEVAGSITPVPGGVGPMTVTMLMSNTFLAAKWRCPTSARNQPVQMANLSI